MPVTYRALRSSAAAGRLGLGRAGFDLCRLQRDPSVDSRRRLIDRMCGTLTQSKRPAACVNHLSDGLSVRLSARGLLLHTGTAQRKDRCL